jgi:hypothetical protein
MQLKLKNQESGVIKSRKRSKHEFASNSGRIIDEKVPEGNRELHNANLRD